MPISRDNSMQKKLETKGVAIYQRTIKDTPMGVLTETSLKQAASGTRGMMGLMLDPNDGVRDYPAPSLLVALRRLQDEHLCYVDKAINVYETNQVRSMDDEERYTVLKEAYARAALMVELQGQMASALLVLTCGAMQKLKENGKDPGWEDVPF